MNPAINNLKELIATYLGLIFKVGIILVILSTLFLFTNLTTEFYDTPKFIILFVFTALLLVLLALKFTLTGKVTYIRTPLDLPLILLLAVALISTFLSPAPYVSLLGNQLKIHSSLIALATYILFYFVLVQGLRSAREVKWILYVTSIAAGILAVVSLLAYSGVKLLPAPWTHGLNFTPTGSSFSTAAILTLLIPLVVSQVIAGTNLVVRTVNMVLLTLFGLTIALTGNWAVWIVAPVALILTLLVNKFFAKDQLKPIKLISLLIPLIIIALVTILSYTPPLGENTNPWYNLTQNFPREVQLPFVTAWKISVSAFRDSPFWGTGPGTNLFNFTTYKPIEYNSTKLWNIRFDTPFNEYLGILGTLGGVGLFAALSLTALFLSSAVKILMAKDYPLDIASPAFGVASRSEPNHYTLKNPLAISGIAFFALLIFYPSTLVLWVIGLLILASFMAVNSSDQSQTWNRDNIKNILMQLSATSSSLETIRIEALPSILLVIISGLALTGLFFGGKFVLADYYHRQALNSVAQNQLVNAYNHLVAAEKLNPVSDLYRTDLAQTNFAIANAIASSKAPSETSPSGSLTAEDQQNIQVLLQQSINEGRTATTLSPRSAINWEILGLLYRQIAGVAQNALVFSLDSYGRAIFQDPLNPLLRLSVGGTYYAIQNYDLAIRFFTDSINLKPDFANGYYNLSVALRDKGDLGSAQAAAEKALALVEQDSEDYQLAQNYLNELKTKSGQTTEPPAAKTTGELQKENLPDVVDVGNPPEKIATPAAVKKPSPTPSPKP